MNTHHVLYGGILHKHPIVCCRSIVVIIWNHFYLCVCLSIRKYGVWMVWMDLIMDWQCDYYKNLKFFWNWKTSLWATRLILYRAMQQQLKVSMIWQLNPGKYLSTDLLILQIWLVAISSTYMAFRIKVEEMEENVSYNTFIQRCYVEMRHLNVGFVYVRMWAWFTWSLALNVIYKKNKLVMLFPWNASKFDSFFNSGQYNYEEKSIKSNYFVS